MHSQVSPCKLSAGQSSQEGSSSISAEFLPGTTHKNTKSRNGTGSSTHPTLILQCCCPILTTADPAHGQAVLPFTKDGKGRSPFLLWAVLSNFSWPSQGPLLTTVTSSVFTLQQRNPGRTSSCSSFPIPPSPPVTSCSSWGREVTPSSAEPVTSS